MRPMTVLFIGQIRHIDLLSKQLEIMDSLPFIKDKILFTWSDQVLDNERALHRLASRHNLRVFHKPSPQFSPSIGFYLHQMCALYHGLQLVSCTDHVLKTRTDCVITAGALEAVSSKNIDIPDGPLKQIGGFLQKVSIIEAEITSPMFFDEVFYYGHKHDLSKIVSFDMTFDTIYRPHTIYHEKYFGHIVSNNFPLFRDFFTNSCMFGGDNTPYTHKFDEFRRAVVQHALSYKEYITVLALYYKIVHEMFTLDWGDEKNFFFIRSSGGTGNWKGNIIENHGIRWGGKSFDDCSTITDIFFTNKHYHSTRCWLSSSSDKFFRRIVTGEFNQCPLGDMFQSAYSEISSTCRITDVGCNMVMGNFFESLAIFAQSILQGETQ